jgi:hypothetical protein
MLGERARQTPANARITVVVDHLTIDIDRIEFSHNTWHVDNDIR